MHAPRSADLLFAQLAAAGRAAKRPWAVDHESAAVTVKDGQVNPGEIAEAARRLAQTVAERGVREGDLCVVRLEKPL
ncbi:hypothetical protein, partial [Streptomyces milbemycinicus]